LAWRPGDQLHLEVEEDRLVLEPVVHSAIDRLYARYEGNDLLAETWKGTCGTRP
jgi:hypothetical protein